MKNYSIIFIPHKLQAYETCGNYYEIAGQVKIEVSDTGNKDYNFLILLHELVEYYLVHKKGIKIENIDKFDMEFNGEGEPGDSKDAPYENEHNFATGIERIMSAKLNIKWQDYEETLNKIIKENQ